MTDAAMSDLLDWTFSDAPLDGEVLLPPPSSPVAPPVEITEDRARKLSLQLWMITSSLVVGLLAVLLVQPVISASQVRLAVAQVVAAEDQAALAHDEERLKRLSEAASPSWLDAQARRAEAGQTAPLPLRILQPVPEAARVRSVEMLTREIVRAEVARKFTTPDGAVVTFLLPQFYRLDGGWKRIESPDAYWGDQIFDIGARLDFNYYPADDAFVTELRPYLEEVLARACAEWTCSADLHLTVNFANRYFQSSEAPLPLAADEPLLLALMPPHITRWGGYTLYLRSPHEVGYPVDAAGRDLLRRAVAAQVVFAVADQIIYAHGGLDQTGNAFFYALVARMTARLGLDSPHVTTIRSASASFTTDQMWQVSLYFKTWKQPEEIRGALAILNRLLQNQPAAAEIELFHDLRSAQAPAAWLSGGLGIPVEAAHSQLQIAASNTRDDHMENSLAPP